MKENSVVAEKCIRNLVERFREYMTAISRNVHVDQLESIANKYNNTYSRYFDFDTENNDKDLKFKVGEHLKISRYINNFVYGYKLFLSEIVFVIKTIKNAVPQTYVIDELNGEESFGTFYE